MVDEIHKSNARIMISIWGKFYDNTANYKELASKGYMWTKNVEDGALDWVGPGYKNSHYDPYTKGAREMYFRQMKPKLIKVIDPSSMRFEGLVSADKIGVVKVGQPVLFRVNGYPGQNFSGKVKRVDPAANAVTRQGVA